MVRKTQNRKRNNCVLMKGRNESKERKEGKKERKVGNGRGNKLRMRIVKVTDAIEKNISGTATTYD